MIVFSETRLAVGRSVVARPLSIVREISVAFRSAKVAFGRNFRGAKGDYATDIDSSGLYSTNTFILRTLPARGSLVDKYHNVCRRPGRSYVDGRGSLEWH